MSLASSDIEQNPAALNVDGNYLGGVAILPKSTAALEVELPSVPWTGNDRRILIDLHGSRGARDETAAHDPEAERTLLVRAAVVDGKEPVLPSENADFVATRIHDSKAPLFEIGDRPNVSAQVTFSSRGSCFLSSSGSHPYRRQAFSKNTRLCHSAGSRVAR